MEVSEVTTAKLRFCHGVMTLNWLGPTMVMLFQGLGVILFPPQQGFYIIEGWTEIFEVLPVFFSYESQNFR